MTRSPVLRPPAIERSRGMDPGLRRDDDTECLAALCRQKTAECYQRYSAASRISARSALAAQNLNSGILPNGSSAGLVSRFAAASA